MKRENQILNAVNIAVKLLGSHAGINQFVCGFKMGAEWADKFPIDSGWRSCLERMPRLGEKVLFKGYSNIQVITPVVLSVIEKTIKEKGDRFYFLVEENELSNS